MGLSNPQRFGLEAVAAQPRGSFIIGVDEVGYGCIAGPVAVCAAVVPAGWTDERVRDSKKLDHQERARLVRDVLVPPNVAFSVVLNHTSQVIDQMGVHHARDDLVRKVIELCRAKYPGALVVMDGNELPFRIENMVCLPKADDLVKAVSAASILAKEDRDECMKQLHKEWPVYGFASHKGYGTGQHNSALAKYGPCPIHRFSYRNIQEVARKFGISPLDPSKPSQTTRPAGKLSGWRDPFRPKRR